MDAAAEDVVAAAAESADVPDLFGDIGFNLDDFDFDLAADEFCEAYAAFVASADADKSAAAPGGWLTGSGIDVGGESGESSPESAVTDGPLAGEEEDMSAYVCELERALLGNDDDVEEAACCPDGAGAEEDLCVDDYFGFGDLLVADHGVAAAADDAAAGGDADEEEESLAAREDDEPTSRKRARQKIKGATMMPCSWGGLEVTRRHLAQMQVPPLGYQLRLLCSACSHWLP